MVHYFLEGGGFMWPILLTLLFGLGFAIERFYSLMMSAVDSLSFFDEMTNAINENGTKIHKKSRKMEPWGRLGASWEPFGCLWGARSATGGSTSFALPRVLASSRPKMGAQGRILDPWRCPGGSKNRPLGQKSI